MRRHHKTRNSSGSHARCTLGIHACYYASMPSVSPIHTSWRWTQNQLLGTVTPCTLGMTGTYRSPAARRRLSQLRCIQGSGPVVVAELLHVRVAITHHLHANTITAWPHILLIGLSSVGGFPCKNGTAQRCELLLRHRCLTQSGPVCLPKHFGNLAGSLRPSEVGRMSKVRSSCHYQG
jgi:hypothetical protein